MIKKLYNQNDFWVSEEDFRWLHSYKNINHGAEIVVNGIHQGMKGIKQYQNDMNNVKIVLENDVEVSAESVYEEGFKKHHGANDFETIKLLINDSDVSFSKIRIKYLQDFSEQSKYLINLGNDFFTMENLFIKMIDDDIKEFNSNTNRVSKYSNFGKLSNALIQYGELTVPQLKKSKEFLTEYFIKIFNENYDWKHFSSVVVCSLFHSGYSNFLLNLFSIYDGESFITNFIFNKFGLAERFNGDNISNKDVFEILNFFLKNDSKMRGENSFHKIIMESLSNRFDDDLFEIISDIYHGFETDEIARLYIDIKDRFNVNPTIEADKGIYMPDDYEEEEPDDSFDLVSNTDRYDIKHSIPVLIQVLNRNEIKKRLKNQKYKDIKREKGKIYSDTIQEFITEVSNGNKKYEIIDGKKVLQPFSPEIQNKLSNLKDMLLKSKTNNYISITDYNDDEYIKTNDTVKNSILSISKFLKTQTKFKIYNSESKYINTSMQTLLPNSYRHMLFHVYYDDYEAIMKEITNSEIKRAITNAFNQNVSGHQRAKGNHLPIGFIRYHYEGKNIWVNTIQSDFSYVFGTKNTAVFQDEESELYRTVLTIIFRYFLDFLHKEKYEYVVIPSPTTRQYLFGSHNAGFTWGYDELPKLFGFEKSKMKDTIWQERYLESQQTFYGTRKVTPQFIEQLNNLTVWTRGNLNESKKNISHLMKYLY